MSSLHDVRAAFVTLLMLGDNLLHVGHSIASVSVDYMRRPLEQSIGMPYW